MTETFHNAYHFTPVSENVPRVSDFMNDFSGNRAGIGELGGLGEEKTLRSDNLGPANFDRYHKGMYSGRLLCKLTTRGPVVVGGRHEESDGEKPGTVHPFELGGEPAVPGTTIKGCISSVMEAASNSALRVLDNTYYSRRAMMNEAMSAMGMIVDNDGELCLKPLALPTIPYDRKSKRGKIPREYSKLFPDHRYKCYCFRKTPVRFDAWTREKPKYYYAKIGGDKVRGKMLGKEVRGSLKNAPPKEKGYVRGILRVLDSPSRKSDMPRSKKHEIFIPFSEEMENDKSDLALIPGEVLERFRIVVFGVGITIANVVDEISRDQNDVDVRISP